ncbi:MAG: leucine-rich repeat domain-containing protein [Thiomargarita sp.]|nr:leucine-rich repeat domain-containing protein [Thiomargarita sp.]
MMNAILKKRVPATRRDINLEEPPWRFYVNRLFDSLMPNMSAVSTAGASSLKSPASILRGVVFVTFIVGMMAMGRIAWADEDLCETIDEVPKAECDALVALYKNTDGDNWSNKSAWLLTDTPCHWHGVTCGDVDDNGKKHVTGLSLYSNRLKNNIPLELSDLAANLQTLNLSYNQLGGEIPEELGSLANLETLNLSYNQLGGDIPAALYDLTELETLYLNNNNLTGNLPSELGNLTNLVSLSLSDNKLTGNLPSELGNLTNLVSLKLDKNLQLTGPLPSNLSNLNTFYFNSTDLCEPIDISFQTWLSNITNISDISHIRYLLRSSGRCSNVVEPYDCNEVTDNILLQDCNALVALYNSTEGDNWNNKSGWVITKTPCSWYGVKCGDVGSNKRVIELSLIDNRLKNNIPLELSNLAELKTLELHNDPYNLYINQLEGNQLNKEIPTALGDLTKLQTLNLSENRLDGEIPAALGDLTKLQTLYLSDNQLEGEIPPDIGHLENLRTLYLSNNQLSGNVPSELGNLTSLVSLRLENNPDLTDPLPSTLAANLTKLSSFYFYSTNLCEPIDSPFQTWLGELSSLKSTGLRCGTGDFVNCDDVTDIPNSECEVLIDFYDSTDGDNWINRSGWPLTNTACNWYGVTCSEVDSNQHVTELFLDSNQLKGKIPPELGYLTELQTLYLYSNQLEGEIPPELGNLANLRTLYLYNNELEGEIPAALGNLENLQTLYLSSNELEGDIPKELGNLTKLQTLNLSYNKLTGNVPSELGALTNLFYLSLDNNPQLTGPLPDTMTNLNLQYFYFRNTDLCESTEPTFQNWLVDVGQNLGSTGVRCTPLNYSDKACSSPTVQTVETGNWDDSSGTWADMSGNSTGAPESEDIVLINESHTITGIPFAEIKALCNKGTLQSMESQPLKIRGTEGIFNHGDMLGKDGDSGQQGSSIILQTGTLDDNGIWQHGFPFYNKGKIQAGNAGNSSGQGGAVQIFGRDVTNDTEGDIIAGKGGDATSSSGGQGGSILVFGKLASQGDLVNKGLVSAGDGGNSNSGFGGFGGSIWLTASNVYLEGTQQAGNGGNGNPHGLDGFVVIEPHVIALSKGVSITGGDTTIFGGDDWTLDFSGLESTAIESTGNITLAVGNNGLVNMTGINGTVLKAAGDVKIFANSILLDDGVELSDVIQAKNIVTAPSKILYDVLLTGLGIITGLPDTTMPLSFALTNNGPMADAYTLTVSDSAGWPLSQLPSSIELKELETVEFVLNVTLPTTRGATDVITVTVTSQADSKVKASTEVQVAVQGNIITPTSLTATAVSQTQIDLSWTDNSNNETGFKVERDGSLITTTAANATSYSDNGLSCDTTYSYSVKATNADGDSTAVTASATTSACPSSRPKPTTRPLRIEIKGSGTGSVTSDPEGIDCSEEDDAICKYTFDMNTKITLTPQAGPDSEFTAWIGDRDCSGGQFVLKQSWVGMLCYAYFRRIETPVTPTQSVTPSTSTLGAYYIPGAENEGQTYVRITNTNETPVEVKGTLYHQDGHILGTAETVLFPELAANATGVFNRASLAEQVGSTSWGQEIAWLYLTAPEDGLRVMNMVRNETKTLANMSLVAETALYNLPGSGETDEGFALIINTSNEPVSVTGTLYAQSGQVLGTPNAILFDSLKAKAMGILSAPFLEERAGTTPWQRAWLQITAPTANLKLMNLNLNNGTVLNMSHVVEDALYNLPGTLVTQDSVKVRFTNTTDEAMQVKGILYHRDGQILGNADAVIIEELAPHATSELSMLDFEERFGSAPWTSRARLVITQPTNGLKLMGLIESHETGTVANASAVGENRLFNVPSPDNFDKGWIRVINTTAANLSEVKGTLYHRDGYIMGTANSVLVENLAADSSVAISQSMLAEAVGTEPWTARATLEITAPATGVKLMLMIRSPSGTLTNLSGALEK